MFTSSTVCQITAISCIIHMQPLGTNSQNADNLPKHAPAQPMVQVSYSSWGDLLHYDDNSRQQQSKWIFIKEIIHEWIFQHQNTDLGRGHNEIIFNSTLLFLWFQKSLSTCVTTIPKNSTKKPSLTHTLTQGGLVIKSILTREMMSKMELFVTSIHFTLRQT